MERQLNYLSDTRDVYDLNREYRRELMRRAEHERLLRLVREDERQPRLHHAIMAWTGRRLVASGRYLLCMAGDAAEPASAPRLYLR